MQPRDWGERATLKNTQFQSMSMSSFYITTAIDYPNSDPHLGHAYERVIADCVARWRRLAGEDVFFLVGTDEHGQKVEKAAIANEKTPKEFVNEKSLSFKRLCSALNISYSRFIRTTDTDHVNVAKQIFQRVLDKGDIYLGSYEGLYCVGCEAFYLEKDAPNNTCPVHKKQLELVKEPSYFFKLSKYEAQVKKLLEKKGFILPDFRREEILNRLKEGLKDLSISRTTFKWGIPLPNDPSHVMYVWFDALINYISGVGYPGAQFKKYWPAVHFVGKDIAWFHTVIWPAMLYSADIPPPKLVHTHGFITLGGEKMSKTRGISIDPIKLTECYGADAVRYFLLSQIPAGQDGDFSEESLIRTANADLGDCIGNLLQRVITLVQKSCDGNIPSSHELSDDDKALISASEIYKDMNQLMSEYEWHRALEQLMQFVRKVNKYVTDQAPWKVKDKKRFETILYCAIESLRLISVLAEPFIPTSANHIREQLGQNKPSNHKEATFSLATRGIVEQPRVLFAKLVQKNEDDEVFSKLNLKVGIIESVNSHPTADRLFVLQINLGAETRTICAGVKQWYAPHELLGKHIVLITNLKPATFRGVTSNGMMLAGEKDGIVRVLEVQDAAAGTQVTIPNCTPKEAQITIDDFSKIQLQVISNRPKYKMYFLCANEHPVIVNLPDGATIR